MLAPAVLALALLATPEQWRSDIDFLGTELPKRHPNAFAHTTRAEFLARLEAVKAEAGDASDAELAIRMQQAVALLRDAHTFVDTRVAPMTWFPLRFDRFGDAIHVTRTNTASRDACAARLVAIDGIDAAEVYARGATFVSAENEQWLAALVPGQMARAETLHAAGVTLAPDRARFTFDRGGVQFEVELAAGEPLLTRAPEANYWFRWDAARRLMHVKYNVCANDPALPFSTFARDVFAIADREQVEAFVIDLRNNGGGDSSVIQPLLDGLKQRAHLRGRVYALIGRETFSSGMFAAVALRNIGAILAGEPTGGKPNAYGEVRSFSLPFSRLVVRHSTRLFTLVPGDPASVEPDLRIDVTAADHFDGRDRALETIAPLPAPQTRAAPSRRRAVSHPAYRCD